MTCIICHDFRNRLNNLEEKKNQVQIMQNEACSQLERCINDNGSYVLLYVVNDHIALLADKLSGIEDNMYYAILVLKTHCILHNRNIQ